MSNDEAIKLLDKYLNNTCSAEERLKVETWLESINSDNTEWLHFSDEDKRAYTRTLFTDLKTKIASRANPKTIWRHKWIYWSAAVILLLAGAFGLFYKSIQPSSDANIVQPLLTKTTGAGEMGKVVLPDGTEVWLNAVSELHYPAAFSGDTREVYIKGEAYFEVATDADKPFIVHGGALNIQVLGTSFDIKAYPKEEEIEVAVLSGKIAVEKKGNKDRTMVLTKNEKAEYIKEQNTLTKTVLNKTQDILAWKQGKLVFYHTPMKKVINDLQRMYDLTISLKNRAVSQCEISGHFDVKQQPEEVLEAICLSIGGQFTRHDGEVVIDGPGCH